MRRNSKKYMNRYNNRTAKKKVMDETNRLKTLGKIDEAIEVLKNEVVLSDDEHFIFELAKLYMIASNYEAALEELKKIENVSTINHFFIYSLMSQCYSEMKEYDKSYEYHVKAYESDERKADKTLKYLLISAMFAKKGSDCLKYINSHPKIQDKKTQLEVVYVYKELEMFQEAFDYINENNLDPEDYKQYLMFSEIFYEVNDIEKANFYIQKIYNLEDENYVLLKAKIKFKNDEYDESVELLNILLAKKRFIGAVHALLIRNYYRLGRISEIQGILDQDCLNKANKMLFQANLDLYNNDYAHARKLVNELVKMKPSVYIMLFLVNLDLREEKYEEALIDAEKILDMDDKYLDKASRIALTRMIAIAKVNLGIPVTEKGYYFSQVAEYSKERTIEHIKSHFESTRGEGVFFPNMNLEKAFELFENRISDIKPNYLSIKTLGDSYLIDFENAGIVGSTILNKMQVVTIINTKKIITFYPVSKLSFNYETEEEVRKEKAPVKRLSQIEKFNQRYNKK